jgi:3-(3-hydroxy-phenyl)propionate hydroxylase
MNEVQHWSVVIVGAGPTGLTLANLLGRYGVRVLLIERNQSTVQEPRAVSIDDEALRTMQAIGVSDIVTSQAVLGYGSEYYSVTGKCFLRVHPTTREYGYPRRSAFRQPIFEAQLRDFLLQQGKVEAWFGSELAGFEQNEKEVLLRVRRPDGAEASVSCDYLAACDGGRSFVREQLGVAMKGSTFRERWLILDVEQTTDPTRDTKVFCNPQRPCISLPGPDRTRRFEFMLHDGESEQAVTTPEFTAKLLQLYGNDHTCPIRRSRVYTFHARLAERWSDGRIYLAGDAAHLSPPFAGQGMNSGIRDAHNLAWKLAAVVQGRLGPRLLQTYEQERRSHTGEMIRLAMRMGLVMMPRNRLGAIAMQTTFRFLGVYPAARDYFAQMRYKPKPRFSSGFFSNVTNGGGKLVGRLFPQPAVEVNGKGSTMLDEVLGNGFALLSPPQTSFAFPTLFEEIPQQLCQRLDIRRVAALAPGARSETRSASTIVDSSGELSRAVAGVPPGLLLLRPDRYVAAFLPAKGLMISVRELEKTVAATWQASLVK